VIKSLSSVAKGEDDEEAVVLEEQYPFGDTPTEEEVYKSYGYCFTIHKHKANYAAHL